MSCTSLHRHQWQPRFNTLGVPSPDYKAVLRKVATFSSVTAFRFCSPGIVYLRSKRVPVSHSSTPFSGIKFWLTREGATHLSLRGKNFMEGPQKEKLKVKKKKATRRWVGL
jgi:hypothetical protein